jgi:hypothetical protein
MRIPFKHLLLLLVILVSCSPAITQNKGKNKKKG